MFSVLIRIFFLIFLLLWASQPVFEDADFWRVSEKTRLHYIRRAAVWHPMDVSQVDIFEGPPSDIAVSPETEVPCRYEEPRLRSRGHSPKFKCRLQKNNQTVRIKFGSAEGNAEIAGTRLLWALGFYSDNDYPVRLKCLGCPEKNPANGAWREKRMDRLLEDTIMEQNFVGKEIGVYPDQGWNWQEIDLADQKFGGSTQAEVDALKLLAVFIQHTDSKHEQQRLACYLQNIDYWRKEAECKKPVLMIQDLGETFGKGAEKITNESAMNFEGWSKQQIWNLAKETEFAAKNHGARVCIGNLTSARFAEGDGLTDPIISEKGRKFLADLLNQLSDHQIADLFRAARADKLKQTMEDSGRKRKVTNDDWVRVFKEKRQQINERRCL